MSAAASPSDLQRARGEIGLGFRRRGAATVLARLRQVGCLQARFLRAHSAERVDTVLLNTSGGIADGDDLRIAVALEDGARVVLATQAAERVYRARTGARTAQVRASITLAAGAAMEWLPQETILFDGAALDRALDVSLAADASFLGLESLVFGRAAMGETLRHGFLQDRVRLLRDGRLILHDAIRLDGDIASLLATPATANGAGAAATLWLVAPDAATRLDALRTALAGAEAGASCWDGMLVARLLAPDAAALRRGVLAALAVLRDGRVPPRVWMC